MTVAELIAELSKYDFNLRVGRCNGSDTIPLKVIYSGTAFNVKNEPYVSGEEFVYIQ